ncbi:hypothetical protein NPIL_378671 [Nephila pilipes]|uniref:Uncharacterized protein n=1 Tax=Nephila pilipes TaxID=299642 RepID=A0A8X6UPR1_NEPPI|nr:hypothetical protein NPIL_378671 [Nephila pilipes]
MKNGNQIDEDRDSVGWGLPTGQFSSHGYTSCKVVACGDKEFSGSLLSIECQRNLIQSTGVEKISSGARSMIVGTLVGSGRDAPA